MRAKPVDIFYGSTNIIEASISRGLIITITLINKKNTCNTLSGGWFVKRRKVFLRKVCIRFRIIAQLGTWMIYMHCVTHHKIDKIKKQLTTQVQTKGRCDKIGSGFARCAMIRKVFKACGLVCYDIADLRDPHFPTRQRTRQNFQVSEVKFPPGVAVWS